jgi:hypothetical protein
MEDSSVINSKASRLAACVRPKPHEVAATVRAGVGAAQKKWKFLFSYQWAYGGEGGIRTPEASHPACRISSAVLSTTQPPLQGVLPGSIRVSNDADAWRWMASGSWRPPAMTTLSSACRRRSGAAGSYRPRGARARAVLGMQANIDWPGREVGTKARELPWELSCELSWEMTAVLPVEPAVRQPTERIV